MKRMRIKKKQIIFLAAVILIIIGTGVILVLTKKENQYQDGEEYIKIQYRDIEELSADYSKEEALSDSCVIVNSVYTDEAPDMNVWWHYTTTTMEMCTVEYNAEVYKVFARNNNPFAEKSIRLCYYNGEQWIAALDICYDLSGYTAKFWNGEELWEKEFAYLLTFYENGEKIHYLSEKEFDLYSRVRLGWFSSETMTGGDYFPVCTIE